MSAGISGGDDHGRDGDAATRVLGSVEELAGASGYELRINIVGFAIEELMLKEEFERWAAAGNGRYLDAGDAAELRRAVADSLALPFQLLADETVVTTGVVGGDPVEVPPGTYRVEVLSGPRKMLGEVTIRAGEETVVGRR